MIAVREIPNGEQRRALFLRYGELIAALGGTYRTSSDMNTNEADMDVIAERTKYVFGRSTGAGGSGNPAPPTAAGVLHGIRASLEYVLGSADLDGRAIVVQGAGGVGSSLAERLAAAGATVLVTDTDVERARAVAARVGRNGISGRRDLPIRQRCLRAVCGWRRLEHRDRPAASLPHRRGFGQ